MLFLEIELLYPWLSGTRLGARLPLFTVWGLGPVASLSCALASSSVKRGGNGASLVAPAPPVVWRGPEAGAQYSSLAPGTPSGVQLLFLQAGLGETLLLIGLV